MITFKDIQDFMIEENLYFYLSNALALVFHVIFEHVKRFLDKHFLIYLHPFQTSWGSVSELIFILFLAKYKKVFMKNKDYNFLK